MANIETLIVPYSDERSGLVTRTGSSTATSPGERELFDHLNIWIPGPAFQNQNGDMTGIQFGADFAARVFPRDSQHSAGYSFRRPRTWVDGSVTARIWYTGVSTDPAENAICRLSLKLSGVRTSYAENSSAFDITISAPTTDAKAFVNTTAESDTTGNGYIEVSPEADSVCVEFIRFGNNASDTYDEELLLIGVECIFRPRGLDFEGLAPWLATEIE